jgi:hypothetical protein
VGRLLYRSLFDHSAFIYTLLKFFFINNIICVFKEQVRVRLALVVGIIELSNLVLEVRIFPFSFSLVSVLNLVLIVFSVDDHLLESEEHLHLFLMHLGLHNILKQNHFVETLSEA